METVTFHGTPVPEKILRDGIVPYECGEFDFPAIFTADDPEMAANYGEVLVVRNFTKYDHFPFVDGMGAACWIITERVAPSDIMTFEEFVVELLEENFDVEYGDLEENYFEVYNDDGELEYYNFEEIAELVRPFWNSRPDLL